MCGPGRTPINAGQKSSSGKCGAPGCCARSDLLEAGFNDPSVPEEVEIRSTPMSIAKMTFEGAGVGECNYRFCVYVRQMNQVNQFKNL
jgi:hypothetical protein